MGKKIATLITDLFEDVEYTEPAAAFKDAGHEIINIEKEKGKIVQGKQGDSEVEIDHSIDDVNVNDFDALFIPGGFSPDQLRADDRFVDFVKKFMEDTNKPVVTICHGPQLLITAKTLEGRTATGYKSIKQDMIYAKANFKDEEVVTDGKLVTSRNPDDIPAFIDGSLKILNQ